ncbi:GNAT family N-acetyltransferase [Streptomyces sp. NPDC085639]|uniref:GNAT family N-acetyltransferase n=1 Tax=Streptomyces sp. NPDC085639 TaxID=3365734 RepID=UPI0037D1432D
MPANAAHAPLRALRAQDVRKRGPGPWPRTRDATPLDGGDARAIPEAYVRNNPVFVLEEDGRSLGFYGFTEEDGDLLLDELFVDADAIGKGYGKALRQHAIRTADGLGRSEFTIASDPNAAPFYAAMGAEEYAAKPTAEPSWTLHMFRYTLP